MTGMAIVDTGIDDVRAFDLPGGIRSDGSSFTAPRAALVRWKSVLVDRLYQVCVNGKFAGVTTDSEQRQMVVFVGSSDEVPARIEVFAVDAAEADVDFSDVLDCPAGRTGRVRIVFLRGQDLPVGSRVEIFGDNGTGEISYESALNVDPIEVWASWQDKCGFGMSLFGRGDFGFDSASAVGLGRGCFGLGQFGLDADNFEWVSRSLEAGVYRFTVRVIDSKGNEVTSETGEVAVLPSARPAAGLRVFSYDQESNQLELVVSS